MVRVQGNELLVPDEIVTTFIGYLFEACQLGLLGLTAQWRHSGCPHNSPGFLRGPMELCHEPAVAICWMTFMDSLKLSHRCHIFGSLSVWPTVEGGPVKAECLCKMCYPTSLDLGQQGYLFGRFISAVALPSRAYSCSTSFFNRLFSRMRLVLPPATLSLS